MTIRRSLFCRTNKQNNSTNVSCSAIALVAGWNLVFAPMGAHAQSATATSASISESTDASTGLAEIVVTARRKGELLQDVPETVTPVTAADIQSYNFQDLKDVSQLVPSLQIVPNNNRSLDSNTFRGVSFQPASGTQNTLGFYLNDTFVTNNFLTTSIFDIGQIELLSGPQGTLRGEPSPSGSMTITTHRPDLEQFGGYVTGTGANHDSWNGNAAVNLPIIPGKLAVRVAGLAEDNELDGVNSINDSQKPYSHTYAGRISVRFEPIDAIEANVMYENFYWNQAQYQQISGPGAAGGVLPTAPANYNGPAIGPAQMTGVQTYPAVTWNHSEIFTGQLDWHFLNQRLSYSGSYWTYADNNDSTALAANQVPGINAGNEIPLEPFQFYTPSIIQHTQTHELRLSSESPLWGFMDYTVGGFFRYTKNSVNVVQLASFFPGAFGSPLGAPDPFTYDPKYTLQLAVDSPSAEKEKSEFLNLTFHLPQNTELTVGGRHIAYTKAGSTEADLLPNGTFAALPPAALGLPGGVPCGAFGFGSTYPNTCDIPASVLLQGHYTALPFTAQNLKDNTWIYNVSLSHKLFDSLLTYVTVGSSWRPPGVSVGIDNANNDPALNSLLHLKPETSTDYEAGVKWTFLENRGRLNVAFFHQNFHDFIYSGLPVTYLSATVPGSPGNPSQFSFNTNPNAVLNGVTVDAGFRPTRQWSFDLNTSYTNGHLTGSDIPCNPPASGFPPGSFVYLCPSHASISVAPNFNSALTSEYHMPIPGTSIDGFVRGLFNYYGRNANVSEFYTAPAYGILNLFLGMRSQDDAWEAEVFAKNALNNKAVLLRGGPGAPTIDSANGALAAEFGSSGYYNTLVTPRPEVGVTATYRFGSR
jgi:iron complex outermembrane recepter protein